jgi:hypothetical protein
MLTLRLQLIIAKCGHPAKYVFSKTLVRPSSNPLPRKSAPLDLQPSSLLPIRLPQR